MRNVLCAVAALCVAGAAHTEQMFAVTLDQRLIGFDSSDPSDIMTGVAIQGVATNEDIIGIDFRPATGELFAVGSFSNLYTLNTATGQASVVGAGNFAPGLNGAWFGFDFNPTIDRIRNVSDANQNLVLNPNDGGSTGVTDLFYPAGDANAGVDPTVAHSAYTNNFAGSTSTQLYGIDVGLDILVTQANSAGTLGTVGPLGIGVASAGGFDISGATNIAYAALQPETLSLSNLYTIDLSTGAASLLGEIAGGVPVNALAVVPEPTTVVLMSVAALCALRRR